MLKRKKKTEGVQGGESGGQRVESRVQGGESGGQRVESRVQGGESGGQRVESRVQGGESGGQRVESRVQGGESGGQRVESIQISPETDSHQNGNTEQTTQTVTQTSVDQTSLEQLMESLLDKDPKIGVWSYPGYAVLQYLYHTKPGFRMSKVAKDALELGLKQLYPDLYSKAESLARQKGLIK
ncbi:hypothetical protein DFR88_03805 [Metallosphaera sedula]|uniref:Uncharacterized protein n=1 Tax=Metallosphaera prunae TaxID=47304 RepID=A0A4D8S4B6_METPR|nr:hypothetical protein DFR88_03805 [Metallosphaera prunae]